MFAAMAPFETKQKLGMSLLAEIISGNLPLASKALQMGAQAPGINSPESALTALHFVSAWTEEKTATVDNTSNVLVNVIFIVITVSLVCYCYDGSSIPLPLTSCDAGT
jgi:hypothetical protein